MLVNEVPALLESAWHKRDEIVVCLLGAPGIGKTQSVYQFAEGKGAKVVEIIASQILPNEVSGITMPVDGTHSMEIYDHARLSSLEDGDILFFDELLQAPEQTLSACLTLIQERRLLSGKKLPDIMIVAAANPIGNPKRIPLSIRQRFQFANVFWNYEAWVSHMMSKHPQLDTDYGKEKLLLVSELITTEDEESAVKWNVFTPRNATKWIEWGLEIKDDAAAYAAWEKAAEEQFSKRIANRLSAVVPSETSPMRRIVKQLKSSGYDWYLEDEVDITPKKLMEIIANLPDEEREEVEKLLKEVEL